MNSREFATFILMGAALLAMVTFKSTRTSLVEIGKLFLEWKVATSLLLLMSNVVIAVLLAHSVGLWTDQLAAATVLWFMFVGFVWLVNLGDAGKQPDFMRRRLIEAVGVGAVLEAFVNLRTLPLLLELLLQVFLAFFLLMQFAASRKDETRVVGQFFGGLVGLLGLGLVAYTVVTLIVDWNDLDGSTIRNEFLLPVWLTLGVVPYVYLLALGSGWQLMAIRLRFANNRQRPPLRVIAGAISELRGSLVDAKSFAIPYTNQAVESGSFLGARRAVRHFRADRAEANRSRAEARARMAANAGLKGTDGNGLTLDRREFAATKEALDWLANAHMGWYRNDDRPDTYRADLLDMLTDVGAIELPGDPPITMHVRRDGRAWYAFRGTPSGHVFGMGANGPPPSEWRYSGVRTPRGYPPGHGWTSVIDETPIEWREEPET